MHPRTSNPANAKGATGSQKTVHRLAGYEEQPGQIIPSGILLQHHLGVLRRAHMEAVSLGARHGVNADALAQHFARQHRAAFMGRAA